MMVIDTVHSSGVGRMHAVQTRRMKIVRPLHSLQGSEVKRPILSSTSAVEKKGIHAVNLESRPSLVTRRRIMVPQLEEVDDAPFHQLTPALSNQPMSSTTTTTSSNHSHEKKLMDRSTARSHLDVIFARSSASTQDEVFNLSGSATMTKPSKTMHLFDLNKLPILSDSESPVESPTSTIASADSTTHATIDAASIPAMVTGMTLLSNSSSSIIKTFTDVEGDALRGGAKLAVDLGLLPPASPEITRRNNVVDTPMQPQCTHLPIPARKRLRKLSEYAGGHSNTTHDPSMAKSWTTDGGDDVCIHRDVSKTLALPEPEAKVRGKAVVDDEVWGAASVLMMLSSSKKRIRGLSSFSSIAEGSSAFSDEDLEGREAGPSSSSGSDDLAASDITPSKSLGSGGSVLMRPSNKQRYRSMAELMAQTPILRRV